MDMKNIAFLIEVIYSRKRVRKYQNQDNIQKDNMLNYVRMSVTFIPNPERLPRVLHKDKNYLNNCFTNFKWVSKKEYNDAMKN